MKDANENKNVLLVVMDTARKKNLTPYGYERNTTPFLEDFSEESVVFDNAISQAPWTLPSHASMFTGEYPSQHGATQESPYLEKEDTLASHMSDEGYRTAIYSANAWISPHTGLARATTKQIISLGYYRIGWRVYYQKLGRKLIIVTGFRP